MSAAADHQALSRTPGEARARFDALLDAMTDEDIVCQFVFRGDLSRKLRAAARKWKRKPHDLVADILEKTLEDDLVGAVIDV